MKEKIDVPRLCSSMRHSRKSLEYFRVERKEAVRQYVGKHWSEEGTREKVPVNLIGLYVSIMSRSLVAKNPRLMLSTFQREQKPVVSAMQSWANKEIERMSLANTLQRVVVDGLFSVGICKVALASPADSAGAGWSLGAGQPFAERVDLDDFVFDVHARDFRECSYIGHRIRVPLAAVKASTHYGKGRKKLSASEDKIYNETGDERLSYLGRGNYANNEEFEDMVDLWEIYLPRHRVIVTLADGQVNGEMGLDDEPLHQQAWLGPDHGPYHLLGFGVVPGNAMPKAPIQDLIDLHEVVNRTYRKLMRTVERLKEVTAVQGGGTEDGNRVMDASDGQMIRVDDPKNFVQMVLSGNTFQQLLLVAPHLRELFSWMAGNLEMMGGLSPQSKTLGQDKLLEQNASRTVADMQDRTVDFTASVNKSLCWYWYHDPKNVMRAKHSLPGMPDMQVQRQVSPQMRRAGKFEDLEIQVDPYSMQHSTPQMRMQQLNQVVQSIVIPMMQLLIQQGVSFDINAYLQKISMYADMPDLQDVITIMEPPSPDAGGGGEKPGMPAQTERTYTRQNMPGRTQQGNDMNLRSALMGVKPGGNPNTNGTP